MEFKTKDDIVSDLLEGWQTEATDEDRANLRNLYMTNTLYKAHSSMGQAIRNLYGLWHPENPLNKKWVQDGSEPYSPYHPDQISQEVIQALCVRLFGPK